MPQLFRGALAVLRALRSSSQAICSDRPAYVRGPTTDVVLTRATCAELLRRQAERHSTKELFVFNEDHCRITYGDFYERCRRLAGALLDLGVRPGDRVGIWGPNSVDWLTTQYACALSGIISVNVNPSYKFAELAYSVHKVDMTALIMCEGYQHQPYFDILADGCPSIARNSTGAVNDASLPSLRHVIVYDRRRAGAWFMDDLLSQSLARNSADRLDEHERRLVCDQPAQIQFTSGTTGRPKGATLSYFGMINNARIIGRRVGYRSVSVSTLFHNHLDVQTDVITCAPPLYHCLGNIAGPLAAIVHSATCVFPSRKFNASLTYDHSVDEHSTVLVGTPTMFIDMIEARTPAHRNAQEFRAGIICGAPASSALCQSIVEKMNMPDLTFGVPDRRLGEQVCAWIQLKSIADYDNVDVIEADIRNWCKDKMAYYKIPRFMQFKHRTDFPMTVTGKIQKFRMRDMAVKELKIEATEPVKKRTLMSAR